MKLFKGEHLHFSADDPPLEPLHRRLKVGAKVSKTALAEMRDWEMIRRSLDPDEVQWARIPARGYFPPAGRGDGFMFLTNKHLFFAWGKDAKFVPLTDLHGIQRAEIAVPPPKRTWMFVSFEVQTPVPEHYGFEIVAAVPAREFVAFYPTIVAARSALQAVAAKAVHKWAEMEAVVLRNTGSEKRRAQGGTVSITLDGTLIFTSTDAGESAIKLADPNVWMTVVDDPSDWDLTGIDRQRRAIVIHDAVDQARYYFQPPDDDGSFDQWAGRLVDLGTRDRPPGWPE